MNNIKTKNFLLFLLIILNLFVYTGCVKKSTISKDKKEKRLKFKPYEQILLEEEKEIKKIDKEIKQIQKKEIEESSIDFNVQNVTGKTLYVKCFSYIKKRDFGRWRWHQSDVYKIKNNATVTIDVDTIHEKRDIENVYGCLAVFNDKSKAEKSTYELLPDKNKLELDRLFKLKNQKVIIEIEEYGFKGEALDHNIVPTDYFKKKHPELDFIVQNKTGKTIYVACFAYELKDNISVWKYDKTTVKKIKPNKHVIIDVDTILEDYNRVYVRGALGIFPDEEMAKRATYELLRYKIDLGRLAALKHKKIVIEATKYGAHGEIIDFSKQETKRIDFSKKNKQ